LEVLDLRLLPLELGPELELGGEAVEELELSSGMELEDDNMELEDGVRLEEDSAEGELLGGSKIELLEISSSSASSRSRRETINMLSLPSPQPMARIVNTMAKIAAIRGRTAMLLRRCNLRQDSNLLAAWAMEALNCICLPNI
jgi:hypothetical protein